MFPICSSNRPNLLDFWMIFLRTNNIEAAGKEQKETSAKEDIFAGQMLLHLYLHDGNYGYEITLFLIITFESTTKQKFVFINLSHYIILCLNDVQTKQKRQILMLEFTFEKLIHFQNQKHRFISTFEINLNVLDFDKVVICIND